jgi:hypothetical protein
MANGGRAYCLYSYAATRLNGSAPTAQELALAQSQDWPGEISENETLVKASYLPQQSKRLSILLAITLPVVFKGVSVQCSKVVITNHRYDSR